MCELKNAIVNGFLNEQAFIGLVVVRILPRWCESLLGKMMDRALDVAGGKAFHTPGKWGLLVLWTQSGSALSRLRFLHVF